MAGCTGSLLTCRKEALSPLVQAEAIEVRRRSDAFQARVEGFRAFFQKSAPFAVAAKELAQEHVRSLPLLLFACKAAAGSSFPYAAPLIQVQGAYAAIQAFHSAGVPPWPSVSAMLAEAAGMRENQELFELHISDYLLLTRCQVKTTAAHVEQLRHMYACALCRGSTASGP